MAGQSRDSRHNLFSFPTPPAKSKHGQLFSWGEGGGATGCEALNPCVWLRLHNHGWEFGVTFLDLVFKAIQQLAFKTHHGQYAGWTQIIYFLTEDLCIDPIHKLKRFFGFAAVQAHSKAQPYYPFPPLSTGVHTECGKQIFSNNCKIQIAWNACFGNFKQELTDLHHISRMEGDVNGKL